MEAELKYFAGVAQTVFRATAAVSEEIFIKYFMFFFYAGVAQLVERQPSKL